MDAPLVLINNVYSCRNRGDSAIVETMIAAIREVAPAARICLLSQFWRENAAYYRPWNVESWPQLWDIPMDNNKWRRFTRAGWELGKVLLGVRDRRSDATVMELYRKADLILDAGGGSLYSSSKYFFYLGLYQHLLNLWWGCRLGKQVVIAPQSIGPFTRAHDVWATRAVLRRLAAVFVREEISAQLLRGWGLAPQVVPDVAFLGEFMPAADGATVQLPPRTGKAVRVGVTVLDWSWAVPAGPDAKSAVARYLAQVAGALVQLHARAEVEVHIVPQVTADFGDSDSDVSQQLAGLLGGRVGSVVVHDRDLAADQLRQLYSQMDLFIGSRMHSTILAMLAGVPTIGLAYQPKTVGTFELLGLGDWVLEVRGLAADELAAKLEGMLADLPSARQRVAQAVADAQAKVREAFCRQLQQRLLGRG